MKIVCDACQAKYSIADDKIQGKAFKIRCKKCNHIIVVKTGGDGAVASSTGAASDKSKATGAAPAAAVPAADPGAWHVVVDGEQVGPLTEAEVKDRLRQGKINSDTLVWKEGFADWMQLSTVPELTAILARITRQPAPKSATREPARPSASMRAVAAPAPSEVEGDPFAAPTVITPAGTADLFASATAPNAVPSPVAPAPSSPFLFGGVSSQPAEPVASKSPGNGAGSTHLTGQRNENSVLFSLSNLEALAMPSHSAGIRPPSGSSNTEGSGLIDIRSMAAMTLHEGGHGDQRRSADSLPTFSTPQFSPVAPVLLPMSTSGPPKWVYPVLGLLAVGILVLGYGIYKVVAAPPPGQPVVVVAPPPPPPAQPVAANPAQPPVVAVAPEAANPAVAETKPAGEEKAPEKVKSDKAKSDKGHRKASDTGSAKSSSDSKKGSDSASASSSSSDSSSSKSGGRKGGKTLEDMLGEVGSKKGSGEDPLKSAPPAVKLITLTQSDIVNAMKGVQPKVQLCANQNKVPGTAMATISVASGGKVNSATVTGKFAGTPTGSCVEAAAKSAKFPACQSMTFPWPFTLSPR